jgi:hypothetical protein
MHSFRTIVGGLVFVSWVQAGVAVEPPASLWSPQRIEAAKRSLHRLKAERLITERQLRRKQAMLDARRQGRFEATALSRTNPPGLNLLQNGGFEEVNRNSARNRSRWLWWGGWSWGGDYENFWESRPEFVHSGHYSAGFRCLGTPGRIGINTPDLPIGPGDKEFRFSAWVKGEGENQLFLNFESGASGSLRRRIGTGWEPVRVTGRVEPGAKSFKFFIYVTGRGVIWLDDAVLVPVEDGRP